MTTFSSAELARRVELVLARPDATKHELEQLCAAARQQGSHCVCVCGSRVELACALLEESEVQVAGLIGFPFGSADSDAKRFETEVAVDHGAQEIETVLNLGRLKDGDHQYLLRELRDIAEAADERHVKVILETSLLTPEELRLACELALDSGVHCVCAGTGLSAPAAAQEIQRMRSALGEKFGIKAAGLCDAPTARALLEAGATRIGAAEGLTGLSD